MMFFSFDCDENLSESCKKRTFFLKVHKCYHAEEILSSGAHVILWCKRYQVGQNVIMWTNVIMWEDMLSCGSVCYHMGRNVIMWEDMLSCGANVMMWCKCYQMEV